METTVLCTTLPQERSPPHSSFSIQYLEMYQHEQLESGLKPMLSHDEERCHFSGRVSTCNFQMGQNQDKTAYMRVNKALMFVCTCLPITSSPKDYRSQSQQSSPNGGSCESEVSQNNSASYLLIHTGITKTSRYTFDTEINNNWKRWVLPLLKITSFIQAPDPKTQVGKSGALSLDPYLHPATILNSPQKYICTSTR